MLTLTMRHRRGDRLAALWGGLSGAWGAVTAGKSWQAEKDAYGLGGWLRVVETTRGDNGWHVHVHALLFVREEPSTEVLTRWKSALFGRWNRALRRAGFASATAAAQDMHLVVDSDEALAGYFTKASDHGDAVALEFTQSQSKKSRSATGGRTPWDILDGVIGSGDADDLDLWHEWESGSKGRRQMTWSRGFRDHLGMGEELTDEQVADEELGDRNDDVIEIPADAWKLMCRDLDLAPLALWTLERDGPASALTFLHSAGIRATWSVP